MRPQASQRQDRDPRGGLTSAWAARQHQPIDGSKDGCIKPSTPAAMAGAGLPLLLRLFFASSWRNKALQQQCQREQPEGCEGDARLAVS
jgi:hypothetical protein